MLVDERRRVESGRKEGAPWRWEGMSEVGRVGGMLLNLKRRADGPGRVDDTMRGAGAKGEGSDEGLGE